MQPSGVPANDQSSEKTEQDPPADRRPTKADRPQSLKDGDPRSAEAGARHGVFQEDSDRYLSADQRKGDRALQALR